MANLCDTCRKRWCKCEGVECRLTQSICKTMAAMRHEADAPVTSCSRYDRMAAIEREDDGTQRCSCCGALWRGWIVCPNCGADWRSKEAHKAAEDEVVRIVTASTQAIARIWVKWRCDECGYVRTQGWKHTKAGEKPNAKYCENCGADMRKEKDDE